MSSEPATELDDKLAAAVERLGNAARTLLRGAALDEGLSTTQAQLLLQLADPGTGASEPATLARRLDVSRPTVADALAALVRKGLVTQTTHPADGRRRVVRLTPSGRAVLRRVAHWDDALVGAVRYLAKPRRIATYRAALDIIAQLVDAGVISVARTCTTCQFFQPDVHQDALPHHCGLLDVALGDSTLRVDCPEHKRWVGSHRTVAGRAEPPAQAQPAGSGVDHTAPIPLYVQLKTKLLEDILGGRYGADDRLPTEHELCAIYRLSRTPVHRALSELAEEGVLVRRRHRGTFVNPHWLRRRADRAELRVLVPDGPWESIVRQAAPPELALSIARVPLPDLHQVLTHAVAEGRAPDLAVLDSVWVHEFAAAGFLASLDELAGEWLAEAGPDLLQPFAAANRHGGQTVAVQAEGDVAGLWYRVDAFHAAGCARPRTWADIAAAAHALADHGVVQPLALPGGSRAGETTTYCLLALLASNGARVLTPDAVTLNTPATVAALRFLRQLVDDGLLPAETVALDWDQAARLLADRQVSMAFGGSYEARTLAAAAKLPVADLGTHFGFVSMPAGPRGTPGTVAGGMVYAVFRQAVQPHLASRLLKRLGSTEQLAQMSRATGQIPPRASAVELVAADVPFLAETARMLPHADVRPATPTYARVSAQLQAMLEAVLTGRLSPAAATQQTAALISAITGLPVG